MLQMGVTRPCYIKNYKAMQQFAIQIGILEGNHSKGGHLWFEIF